MANTTLLQPLEDVCQNINALQNTVSDLDQDLQIFDTLVADIEKINIPFPVNLVNDLNIFSNGLQEVDKMVQELNKVTLANLDAILSGASTGIETLLNPIPKIISDAEAISTSFAAVQTEISSLLNPSSGVEANLGKLNSQLTKYSNSTPQSNSSNIGTGVLNAISSELQRAIADNITLKNKYDNQVNSIVSQINSVANNLSTPVSSMSKDGSNLDSQIKNINTYLTNYKNALTGVIELSGKVDEVVVLLDKFKPDVDIVYGIVQPLGWFIELIEKKTCNNTAQLEIDTSNRETRLNHYANSTNSVDSKFQAFEQMINQYFQNNNIGQKIGEAVQNILPINELQTAIDSLNQDLVELSNDSSVKDLLASFATISADIDSIEDEIKTLNTDAKRASGTVTLQRVHPNAEVKLLKGTILKCPTTNVIFATTKDAVFKAGSFNTDPINATAQAVGTSGNVAANAITDVVSTPKNGDSDNYSVSASTPFTGGTDISVDQIQGEANQLAKDMLPVLTRLFDKNNPTVNN